MLKLKDLKQAVVNLAILSLLPAADGTHTYDIMKVYDLKKRIQSASTSFELVSIENEIKEIHPDTPGRDESLLKLIRLQVRITFLGDL